MAHRRVEPIVRQAELEPIHDFAAKLTQPSVIEHLRAYVDWQARCRRGRAAGRPIEAMTALAPELAPLSINLDLTTACNFACDHCVDADILNLGVRHDLDVLRNSLATMAERGLRSVIIIGGGEPTVHPRFVEVVRHLKALRLKVGLVTNGSRLDRVREAAAWLEPGDWIRISLDAGSDALFQTMHRPRRPVSLDEICAGVPAIKRVNPHVTVGFSFIVVWRGCTANDSMIHENVDEMVPATRRAKHHEFDYISFKPFLTRAEGNNAEVVDLPQHREIFDAVIDKIGQNIDEARCFSDSRFSVIESTNLKVLRNGTFRDYTTQPRTCHLTFFRQVLSPLGVYHCPVYRNVPRARIGARDAYATPVELATTARRTLDLIDSFDAAAECRQVTCLYNHANWFIEHLIENPDELDRLAPNVERFDDFL